MATKEHSGTKVVDPICVVDTKVVNADTIYNITDPGLSFFAVLCGQNRGAFVLSNYTYSCLNLPEVFALRAGIMPDNPNNVTISTANDISEHMQLVLLLAIGLD